MLNNDTNQLYMFSDIDKKDTVRKIHIIRLYEHLWSVIVLNSIVYCVYTINTVITYVPSLPKPNVEGHHKNRLISSINLI